MARLLSILLVGLVCEAIGVVFLSRGLKEIVWLFSNRELRDAEGLADKLRRRADPVSDFVWQKLTPRQQTAMSAPEAGARRGPALIQALNQLLPAVQLYGEKRFAGVRLSDETQALLLHHPAGEQVQLNRLLLQDAYPAELAKAGSGPVTPSHALGLAGRAVANPPILLGIFFEALFFIGLLMLMSKAQVSFIWPLTSLGFAITTLAAKFYLQEQVSLLRWSGVCLIMLGAGLITWTEKQADSPSHPGPVLRSPTETPLSTQ